MNGDVPIGNTPFGCGCTAIVLIVIFLIFAYTMGGLGIGIFFGLWFIISFVANKYG